MVCWEFLVKGRVQGVLFRRKIRFLAKDLGLRGFVENLDDGDVRIIACGDSDLLKKFAEIVEALNGRFRVDEIIIGDAEKANYENFRINRKDGFFVEKFKALKNLFGFSAVARKIPVHVAIIPDGNRRWARRKGWIGTVGHAKSAEKENLVSLATAAKNFGVKYLSLWGFSTENWKRSEEEKKFLFDLFLKVLNEIELDLHKNKIRFRHLGRKDRLPEVLLKKIEQVEKSTMNYDEFNFNLCLDYGGRDELLRAVNVCLKSKKKKFSEEEFSELLDTKNVPDPDLIIRTSGENRTSGFMPFQSVYSELYFSKKMFPDFKAKDLQKAIRNFGNRKRRFGGS